MQANPGGVGSKVKLSAFGLSMAVLFLVVACVQSWRATNYVHFEWTSGLQRQNETQARRFIITRSFEKIRRRNPWKRDLLKLSDGTVLSMTIYDRSWIITPRVIIPEVEEE